MNKINFKKNIIILLFFLTLFFVINIFRMCFFASTDNLSLFVSRIIPISVMKVNNEKINYKDYIILSRLSETGMSFGDVIFFSDDKSQEEKVFEQLIYRSFLCEMFEKYEIEVSRDDKENNYDIFLKQFSDKREAKKYIKNKYNVSLSDYKKYIIDNNLFLSELDKVLSEDKDINKNIEDKLTLIIKEIENNKDFTELAIKYSQDDIAKKGGNLGWFSRGKMVPEVENVLYSLEKNEIYPKAIKTIFGYHFVKLDDFDKGDKKPSYDANIKASQILIRKPSSISLAQDMFKNADIKIKLKKLKPYQDLLN